MAIVLLILCFYLYLRVEAVYQFRSLILSRCIKSTPIGTDIDFSANAFLLVYEKMPSYSKMVFSFKPLFYSYWLTKEQIQMIDYE